MKILVINGPNLNMLGIREPEIYGRETYAELVDMIKDEARRLGVEAAFFQSNHEGAIIDEIQAAYGVFDAIVLNPAALTHTSIALLDAVKAVGIPTVEVHISDPDTREAFRQPSFVSVACAATIKGKGFAGYVEAIELLQKIIEEQYRTTMSQQEQG